MPAEYQLTFKPYANAKGGRWSKKIKGKVHYFGTAPNKSDRASYRQAVEKWRAHLEAEAVKDRENADVMALVRATAIRNDPEASKLLDELIEAEQKNRPPSQGCREGARPSLDSLTAEYLDEQQRRHQITLIAPESLAKKEKLTASSLKSINDQIKPFRNWVEAKRVTLGSNSQETEAMLRRYREDLEQKMIGGELSPTTVSNRVRGLRRLITWFWQRRYLEDMPRNLDEVCKKYSQKKDAKALTVAQVGKLWKKATPMQQAFIALSLNCGFYFSESAKLKGADIKNGYVARRRPKTGVAAKHKLWAITQKLIAETRTNKGKDDYLWITSYGFPLIHHGPKGRTDTTNKAWRELATAVKVKAQASQLRDTAATNIEAIGLRSGNPQLVSQFLSHADARTARFYIDQRIEPHALQTKMLDAAIDELWVKYAEALK